MFLTRTITPMLFGAAGVASKQYAETMKSLQNKTGKGDQMMALKRTANERKADETVFEFECIGCRAKSFFDKGPERIPLCQKCGSPTVIHSVKQRLANQSETG